MTEKRRIFFHSLFLSKVNGTEEEEEEEVYLPFLRAHSICV